VRNRSYHACHQQTPGPRIPSPPSCALRPNATHVATRELKTGTLGVDGLGDELMRLVAQVRAAGFDPELELRAVTRHFADRVRDWERADGVG
jgi:hypothetical protein